MVASRMGAGIFGVLLLTVFVGCGGGSDIAVEPTVDIAATVDAGVAEALAERADVRKEGEVVGTEEPVATEPVRVVVATLAVPSMPVVVVTPTPVLTVESAESPTVAVSVEPGPSPTVEAVSVEPTAVLGGAERVVEVAGGSVVRVETESGRGSGVCDKWRWRRGDQCSCGRGWVPSAGGIGQWEQVCCGSGRC